MATMTALVCDGDELGRRALWRTAEARGLDVVGEATTAVEALQMLGYQPADVVILANELQGLSGIEVVPELVEAGRRVVLVSADVPLLDQARRAGAFAAVERGDLELLERVLDQIGTVSGQGTDERRSGTDRRSGVDRRTAQDWSKVIRERREGERREGERRSPADQADATTLL